MCVCVFHKTYDSGPHDTTSYQTLRTNATAALRQLFGEILTDLAGVSFVPASSSDGGAALLVLSQETKTVARLSLDAVAGRDVAWTPADAIAVNGKAEIRFLIPVKKYTGLTGADDPTWGLHLVDSQKSSRSLRPSKK